MPAPSDFPSPQHGRSGPTNKVRGSPPPPWNVTWAKVLADSASAATHSQSPPTPGVGYPCHPVH